MTIRVMLDALDVVRDTAHSEARLRDVQSASGSQCVFIFSLTQYWLPNAGEIALLVAAEKNNDAFRVLVCKKPAQLIGDVFNSIDDLAKSIGAKSFDLASPWKLLSVEVPKPWGREIWFTGVEARGVCGVEQGGYVVPIPWLIEVCGSLVVGVAPRKLVLLKILDPLPEAVFGDLYVELHEQKQEVYVVTDVDRIAWPDGIGLIKFGFNQALVQNFGDETAFRDAYLNAVSAYRDVRVQIDALLDEQRVKEHIGLNAPVSAQQQQRWLQQVPVPLVKEEARLRVIMDEFYGSLPLRVGDVVKVPCYVPHSLQHGVTTIEFQTPVYERKIMSFAQKVLTQSHWDTRDALSLCSAAPTCPDPLQTIHDAASLKIERIVDFDDFEVFRVRLGRDEIFDLSDLGPGHNYAELMVISGTLLYQGGSFDVSCAYLIGRESSASHVATVSADSVFVVAFPKN